MVFQAADTGGVKALRQEGAWREKLIRWVLWVMGGHLSLKEH